VHACVADCIGLSEEVFKQVAINEESADVEGW